MFRPASDLPYRMLSPEAQVLVVVDVFRSTEAVESRWKGRACAAAPDLPELPAVRSIVRDLLNNPQVRAVVFDGECRSRAAFDDVWSGRADLSGWKIDEEHLSLVRQFVDLFDDEYTVRKPLQPFWPARIFYLA